MKSQISSRLWPLNRFNPPVHVYTNQKLFKEFGYLIGGPIESLRSGVSMERFKIHLAHICLLIVLTYLGVQGFLDNLLLTKQPREGSMTVNHEDNEIKIEKYLASNYNNNLYIVECKKTGEIMVIDAPKNISAILQSAELTQINLLAITHGHFDHIEGFNDLPIAIQNATAIHQADSNQLPIAAPRRLHEARGVASAAHTRARVRFWVAARKPWARTSPIG